MQANTDSGLIATGSCLPSLRFTDINYSGFLYLLGFNILPTSGVVSVGFGARLLQVFINKIFFYGNNYCITHPRVITMNCRTKKILTEHVGGLGFSLSVKSTVNWFESVTNSYHLPWAMD